MPNEFHELTAAAMLHTVGGEECEECDPMNPFNPVIEFFKTCVVGFFLFLFTMNPDFLCFPQHHN